MLKSFRSFRFPFVIPSSCFLRSTPGQLRDWPPNLLQHHHPYKPCRSGLHGYRFVLLPSLKTVDGRPPCPIFAQLSSVSSTSDLIKLCHVIWFGGPANISRYRHTVCFFRKDLWAISCSARSDFPCSYVAYHHFRSKARIPVPLVRSLQELPNMLPTRCWCSSGLFPKIWFAIRCRPCDLPATPVALPQRCMCQVTLPLLHPLEVASP